MDNNIQSVLVDQKRHLSHTLEIYEGIQIHKINSQAKSFSQDDYEMLSKLYKTDTIREYWNKKESKSFLFKKLITTKEISNYPLSFNNDSITNLYHISKPIFIKKKKHALFSVLISRGTRMIMDDYVIIMKKEKGKWVFLEKVYSTDLH